jgi:hypothetical protein
MCCEKENRPLRDALQRDEGQVLAPGTALDEQFILGAGSTSHERLGPRARRRSQPSLTRLEPRLPARGHLAEVNLVGCGTGEELVGPVGIEPGHVPIELALESSCYEGHEDQARALGLHRPDEPLDDGEAAVLPDRAEPLLDASTDTKWRTRRR